MAQSRAPYRAETIHGTPIQVLDRTLIPVARVTSVTRHRATIREHSIEGTGSAIIRVRPLCLIEAHRDDDMVFPIQDITARTVSAMAWAAIAVALISLLLILTHRLSAQNQRSP
jgi:hypothetical protein